MKKYTFLFLIFLAGCGGWHATSGEFHGSGYAVDLPSGWMYESNFGSTKVNVTRDGEPLQKIHFDVFDITKYDKDAKKTVRKGMLPEEVAQVVIDITSANKSVGQFTVMQNEPAQVGGKNGFRLLCSYRRGKVRYKSAIYGVLDGETLYGLIYSAPVRYYFDRDVAAFEAAAKSFRLEAKKAETAAPGMGIGSWGGLE
ncbi:MAG TPA: hypothetical protein VL197_11295 [Nitrospirota bacterium]|nr:hypothetical protein [Nitrospirota bacterium]